MSIAKELFPRQLIFYPEIKEMIVKKSLVSPINLFQISHNIRKTGDKKQTIGTDE